MPRALNRPYPYEILLTAIHPNTSLLTASCISERLSHLPGHRISFGGQDLTTLRYAYDPRREAYLVDRARKIVRLGGEQAAVSAFVVWCLCTRFQPAPPLHEYTPRATAVRKLHGVLDLSTNSDRTEAAIEFRGEPSQELIRKVYKILSPFAA